MLNFESFRTFFSVRDFGIWWDFGFGGNSKKLHAFMGFWDLAGFEKLHVFVGFWDFRRNESYMFSWDFGVSWDLESYMFSWDFGISGI